MNSGSQNDIKMEMIKVKSQEEYNAIPNNYNGEISIVEGVVRIHGISNVYAYGNAIVEAYNSTVKAYGDAQVDAYDNSTVHAYDNSIVDAYDDSTVEANNNAKVYTHNNSTVYANDNSTVHAYDDSTVEANDNAKIYTHDNSTVFANNNSTVDAYDDSIVYANNNAKVYTHDNSIVEAYYNSTVYANSNSIVEAKDNARVYAHGNSLVGAYNNTVVFSNDNARVYAYGNAQVCDNTRDHKIKTFNNARIIHIPRNIDEYISFYNITEKDGECILYKAVHKVDTEYISDRDGSFKYVVGKIAEANVLNIDINERCGAGINLAPIHWCLEYGKTWDDLAIIELKAKRDEIIVPIKSDGKVRVKRAEVIREVPLDECGILGKILAKRKEVSKWNLKYSL